MRARSRSSSRRAGRATALLRTTVTGPLAGLLPQTTEEYEMVAVEPDLFVVRTSEEETWTPATFYALGTGERYLHVGARATPQVGELR